MIKGDHGLINNSDDHCQEDHCSDYFYWHWGVTNLHHYKNSRPDNLKGSVRGKVSVSYSNESPGSCCPPRSSWSLMTLSSFLCISASRRVVILLGGLHRTYE